MIKKIFLLLLLLFLLSYQIAFAEIKVNSIISLKNNIPDQCGLNFVLNHENYLINTSVSIKKNNDNDNNTLTEFLVKSDGEIRSADILTSTSSITKIINKQNKSKKEFLIISKTKQDLMTFFFQELLIGGGQLIINELSHQIKGPIDSKVRLEYLFCTGEMFLPNYD